MTNMKTETPTNNPITPSLQKARNSILALVFGVLLFGPILMIGFQHVLKIELPEWLSPQSASFLEGGSSRPSIRENLNFEGISNGKLQLAIDGKLQEYAPCRSAAILGSSSIERSFINTSNALFNWNCYPTYYGSDRIYIPSFDAVAYMPQKQADNEAQIKAWDDFANNLLEVATEYPEKKFVVYLVQGYYQPAFNPAYELISDPFLPDSSYTIMSDKLKSIDNISVLTKGYDSGEDYFHDFFTTDHHWNILGALEAYEQLADELDFEINTFGDTSPIEDYLYTGATARWGRDLVMESVFDVAYDFSDVKIEFSNGYKTTGANHDYFWNYPPAGKRYAFYDAYYDNLTAPCVLSGDSGDKDVLFVSNSYGAALQRPLATSYKNVYTSRRLHPSCTETETLRQQIEQTDADDIIFLANPSRMISPKGYFD